MPQANKRQASVQNSTLNAFNLILLREGDALLACLSDGRSVAQSATRVVPEAVLDDLRQALQALCRRADDEPADAGLRGLGCRLFDALLPPAIGRMLRASPPRTLGLQLAPALAWVPWELACDGERLLGEAFRLGRRIVADEESPPRALPPPRGPLAVHLLHAEAADAPAAQALLSRLQAQSGMVASQSCAPPDIDDSLSGHTVLHRLPCAAAADERAALAALRRQLRAIADLPVPPSLLVAQIGIAPDRPDAAALQQALALEAGRCGLELLTLAAAADRQAPACDFAAELYRALAQGESFGEAVRLARAQTRLHGGAAALLRLRAELHGDGEFVPRPREGPARGEDNLRQVTIMSFDLVGSTVLLGEMGAERYSELLARYHETCTGILTRHGGTPDDPQGNDGLMCYFGFPAAREDAADQALRAGLEIIDAVRGLDLLLRVGVCTGRVVVRDGQPVGAAVHFAARLQSIAAPGTLVVGDSTRRLAKGSCRFERIEQVPPLKGFAQHEALFRALPQGRAADAPDELLSRLSPFVGRHQELRTLEDHWARARAGALRVVRVVGEAGIGKSRLLREFKRSLTATGHQVFECHCAAEQMNSAFHPMAQALRNELGLGVGECGDAALDRLAAQASRLIAPDDAAALLAELLAIPAPRGLGTRHLSPERRRQLTLGILVELGKARVRGAAGCLIVEDVHWIDPSTGDLLERLAAEAADLPLLILLSSRPDAERRWQPRMRVHDEELRGISADAARLLVVGASGDVRLPSEIVHQLAARADGVPLFIEESTRMAIELGAERTARGEAVLQAVPTTIEDLLTARLDRLAEAKQVAQICATIGREFPLPLLQAVLEHAESPFRLRELPLQLASLLRSGMLLRRGEAQAARYRFKHALLRDAAYRSLLERDRSRLHRVIAAVLRERFRELSDGQPELLALHLTEAGELAEALPCWEAAARQAASRSAHVEAIGYVNTALEVAERRPRSAERDRVELRLQLLLATRLIATEGYGSDRVERVYARATALTRALGDDAAELKVLLGQQAYHSARAEFGKAMAIAEQAAAKAQGEADAIHRVQLKWAVANLVMHQGEMAPAVLRMDECLAEYDRLQHRSIAVQDPGVMCLCYSAWALWQLGCADQALQRVRGVVARAERLEHPFSLGEAYGFLAAIHRFRGENEPALAAAERAIGICEEGGFSMWLALARLIRGRLWVDAGEVDAGIEEMRLAHELWQSTGAVLTTPFYLALRAEGYAAAGQPELGLPLLEQARQLIEHNGERYYEAEVLRLQGVLLLQQAARGGADRDAEAEVWLRRALDAAQARALRAFALRAAVALAQLWHARGRAMAARELLQAALSAMDEGEQTLDLRQARALLQAWVAAAAARV